MEYSNDTGFDGFKTLMTHMVRDFDEIKGPAETMARAISALSDAQSFEALVNVCAELVWMRKQMEVSMDICKKMGPEHVGAFLVIANAVLDFMRDGSASIDPAEVLKQKKQKEDND